MKGNVTKRQLDKKIVLERKTLAVKHVLTLDEDMCVGCGICEAICPKESPKLSPAETRDGRLVQKPRVDFEADKCIFCGECVDLCPTNAIKIERNDERRLPLFDVGAFPTLEKLVDVDAKKCWYGGRTADCDIICQKECPTEAIEVTVEKIGEEPMGRIVDFKVAEEDCIFCKKCEIACPENAIQVTKPFRGSLQVDTSLCPSGCQLQCKLQPETIHQVLEWKRLADRC